MLNAICIFIPTAQHLVFCRYIRFCLLYNCGFFATYTIIYDRYMLSRARIFSLLIYVLARCHAFPKRDYES